MPQNEVGIELLTACEVAALLRVSRDRVYTLARRRLLPSVHLGAHIRFEKSQLEQWIAEGGAGLHDAGDRQ